MFTYDFLALYGVAGVGTWSLLRSILCSTSGPPDSLGVPGEV